MDRERVYSPEFKAKAVLKFIRKQKSADQICTEHGIPRDLLRGWTQEFLENAHLAFSSNRSEDQKAKRIKKLERLVRILSRDLGMSIRSLRFMSRILSTREAAKDSNLPKTDRDLSDSHLR
jgi:transposase-like protein